MTIKIAHLSDLHIHRSIREHRTELEKKLQPKHEEIYEIKNELKKLERELIERSEVKNRLDRDIPQPPNFPKPEMTPGVFGIGPQELFVMERTQSLASEKYEREFGHWQKYSKAFDLPSKEIEELEFELAKLKRKKWRKKSAIVSLEKEIKIEKQKLQDQFYHRLIESEYKQFFPKENFPILLKSLDKLMVDHVVVTGDITNLSRPLEYDSFKSEFSKWIDNRRISVVPGNHDTNLFKSSISFFDGLKGLIPDKYPDFIGRQKTTYFPYVKELEENICLIGLDSTVNIKTPGKEAFYGNAIGEMSKTQFNELEAILKVISLKGKIIIIAIHHHLLNVPDYGRKQVPIFMDKMKGADRLLRLLVNYGVRIILSGHVHCPLHIFPSANWPEILISDSMADPFGETPTYHLLTIENENLYLSIVRMSLP